MIFLKQLIGAGFAAAAAANYRSTILADNPLFYYRLGESSGTDAYDEVAASNNGTYFNTPTLGQAGALSGDSNTSVLFEQANSEYVETATLSGVTSLLPCTIECFIKTSGASDSNGGVIFYRNGSNASGINIKDATLGKLGYHWNNATVTWSWTGGPTMSDNTWYYVALVVESTEATIYMIDEGGTLTTAVNSVSHSALNISTDGWQIGRDTLAGRFFQGYVDEVAIYDTALSQSTLVAHAASAGFAAQAGFSPSDVAGMVNWYDASDASTITESAGDVSQWDDKSGNAYHLTQSNGTYKPTTGTRTINSLNVLDFATGDFIDVNTATSYSQPNTIFLVYELDSQGSGVANGVFCDGFGASNRHLIAYAPNYWRNYAGTQISSSAGPSLASEQSTHIFNTTTSSIRVNGAVAVASASLGTQALSGLAVGRFSWGTAGNIDGGLAEIIIYNAAVSADDIDSIETYLQSKWGTP